MNYARPYAETTKPVADCVMTVNKVPAVAPQSDPSRLLQTPPASSPTSPSLAAQVYADQVALLYRNSPVGFAVSLVA